MAMSWVHKVCSVEHAVVMPGDTVVSWAQIVPSKPAAFGACAGHLFFRCADFCYDVEGCAMRQFPVLCDRPIGTDRASRRERIGG